MFGVDIESTPLIVLAVIAGLALGLLAATALARRPVVLLTIAAIVIAWAAPKRAREEVHQIDESTTNPLERFNKEIGRRTDVVGIFPEDRSLIRLAGMLCIEQNDEWLVGRGYLSAESVSLVLPEPNLDIHTEIKEETAQLQAA